VRPRPLAVFMLITRSIFVTCITGRIAGFFAVQYPIQIVTCLSEASGQFLPKLTNSPEQRLAHLEMIRVSCAELPDQQALRD